MKNFPEPNSRLFYFVSIVNMNSLSVASQFLACMLKVSVILAFDRYEFCGRCALVGKSFEQMLRKLLVLSF